MTRKYTLALVAALACTSAHAHQVLEGKVKLLQPTYLPGIVSFQMTVGSSLCPAGGWLQWANADKDNNKAVYATLMAAFMAEKTVRLYINDGDTTCTGVFMHVVE
jgi:hypothetical protein